MKINLFAKTVLISIFAFFMAYICYHHSKDVFATTHHKFWHMFSKDANYKTFDEDVSFKDINEVIIDADSADIEINSTAQQEGNVSFTTGINKNHAFQVKRKAHQLLMKISNLTDYPYSTLTLKIPHHVTSMIVKSDAGDIQINEMALKQLTINTLDGDISLKNGSVDQAFLHTINGDALSSSKIKKLQINTVSGDIQVKATNNIPSFDLSAVSGDILIRTAPSFDAKLFLKTVNGDIQSKTTNGNEANGLIKASTVTGDIRVKASL